MPNGRTREPFRRRGRRTKNDRVFGERRVYRARMAASKELRVTPSRSMQPTTGLPRWQVHIPTDGRSMPSPPADFACDGSARHLSQIRVSDLRLDGQTNVIQVSTRVSDGLLDVGYQWYRSEACGCTHWRTLAPTSSRIRRIQPPVEARVWAKTGAGGRSTGGWRRHRRISPLVYASQ